MRAPSSGSRGKGERGGCEGALGQGRGLPRGDSGGFGGCGGGSGPVKPWGAGGELGRFAASRVGRRVSGESLCVVLVRCFWCKWCKRGPGCPASAVHCPVPNSEGLVHSKIT